MATIKFTKTVGGFKYTIDGSAPGTAYVSTESDGGYYLERMPKPYLI